MEISANGLEMIKRFEGFSAVQYDDGTGTMTIGFGTTAADIRPLPTHVTVEQATALLKIGIDNSYAPAVRGLGIHLSQNQFDALCSFVYNLGPGSMSSSFTIGRLLRAREYAAAANSMLSYVFAGGRRLQGLVNRREAERALFLRPDPPPPDPHHYGRFPNQTFHFNGRAVNERQTVELYDRLRKHGILNRRKLKPVRADLTQLRKRVWTVAHHGQDLGPFNLPPLWGVDWLGWRYGELLPRSQGETVKN